MKLDEREIREKLDGIQAHLARHERLTRLTLLVVAILAGLALVLLTTYIFDYTAPNTK
jgi:uncharacterized membrane-anchored protein